MAFLICETFENSQRYSIFNFLNTVPVSAESSWALYRTALNQAWRSSWQKDTFNVNRQPIYHTVHAIFINFNYLKKFSSKIWRHCTFKGRTLSYQRKRNYLFWVIFFTNSEFLLTVCSQDAIHILKLGYVNSIGVGTVYLVICILQGGQKCICAYSIWWTIMNNCMQPS